MRRAKHGQEEDILLLSIMPSNRESAKMKCISCKGTGKTIRIGTTTAAYSEVPCSTCEGTGKVKK
jgi:DnaJ-class molecular chaperone